MQLKLTRSQKTTGMMTKTVVFVIAAQAVLSAEEQALVQKYGLGKDTIYASEAMRDNLDGAKGCGWRGPISLAKAAMSLRITVDSLTHGQTVECKSLDEALAAEEAIMNACQNLLGYIKTAQTFDNTTQTIDITLDAA